MTIERAFRVAHNLDVPSRKRKHWPQWAVVVVRSAEEIDDVIQFTESPKEEDQKRCLVAYPKSMSFTVKAGEWHVSIEDFATRVHATAGFITKLISK